MKLFKKKRPATKRSAGELYQFEQLTSVTPIDIDPSEQIRYFVSALPKRVGEKLKLCSADHYNTDMFDEGIHRAFSAEAEHKAAEYDNNLHTIHMIYRIHCGIDAYMDAHDKLYKDDITKAETELERLSKLQSSL